MLQANANPLRVKRCPTPPLVHAQLCADLKATAAGIAAACENNDGTDALYSSAPICFARTSGPAICRNESVVLDTVTMWATNLGTALTVHLHMLNNTIMCSSPMSLQCWENQACLAAALSYLMPAATGQTAGSDGVPRLQIVMKVAIAVIGAGEAGPVHETV